MRSLPIDREFCFSSVGCKTTQTYVTHTKQSLLSSVQVSLKKGISIFFVTYINDNYFVIYHIKSSVSVIFLLRQKTLQSISEIEFPAPIK